MPVTTRQAAWSIASIGAVAGAIYAVWQVVALAAPVIRSDNPPWQGQAQTQAQVTQIAATLDQVQHSLSQLYVQQQVTATQQAFLSLPYWQEQKSAAEAALKRNPYDPNALQALARANQEIAILQQQITVPK